MKIVSKGDYDYTVVIDHPKRTIVGSYVLAHRHIMELSLGRYLSDDEVVHHINEDKKDNRIENLQLLSRSEHSKLHTHVDQIECICGYCGSVFYLGPRDYRQRLKRSTSKILYCDRNCWIKDPRCKPPSNKGRNYHIKSSEGHRSSKYEGWKEKFLLGKNAGLTVTDICKENGWDRAHIYRLMRKKNEY